MVEVQTLVAEPAVQAVVVLAIGLVIGLLVGRLNRRVLRAANIPEIVEGTPFERTARSLGTSTVDIVARLSAWLIYGVAIVTAFHVARLVSGETFWLRITAFIPRLFVAAFVLILGFVVADKAELLVSERMRGVKLPDVSIIPKIAKYSILYVAFLVALSQVGVSTTALLILLGAYLFGTVFLAGLAFRHMLQAGAAGIYLLLRGPYGIGDEVRIGDRGGIVQEVSVFTTRVEDEEAEYVVPNHKVFQDGVAIVRK